MWNKIMSLCLSPSRLSPSLRITNILIFTAHSFLLFFKFYHPSVFPITLEIGFCLFGILYKLDHIVYTLHFYYIPAFILNVVSICTCQSSVYPFIYFLCPFFFHRIFEVAYKNACKYNKTEKKSQGQETYQ